MLELRMRDHFAADQLNGFGTSMNSRPQHKKSLQLTFNISSPLGVDQVLCG